MSRLIPLRRFDSGRQALASLVEHNVALLEQGAALIAAIDDATYATPAPRLGNATAGAHVRHCLDYYLSILDGMATGLVDHGGRARQAAVERSRERAAEVVDDVIVRLRESGADDYALELVLDHDPGQVVATTVARELEAAASHTIHHYAVIAVLLRARNVEVPPDFGFSPSTLRYLDRA